MGVGNILKKLLQPKVDNRENQPRLTPDEVELMSYERRAYLDAVKRKVHQYRKQDSNDIIMGKNIIDNQTILKANNVFKDKNRFKKAKRIL